MAQPAPTARDRDRNEAGRAENQRPRDRFGAPLPRDAEDEMAERVEPADVVTTVDEALQRGIALFDEQRFFEAHEFFEWIWKSGLIDDAERTFWKGVAQVAVGYVHTQRGNASGARTLLERGATHVRQGYPDRFRGVDAARLAADADAFGRVVEARGASPEHEFPAFPRG